MVATSKLMIAASSIFPLVFSAPIVRRQDVSTFSAYTPYGGSGSTEDGWPSQNEWMSFDQLWSANEKAFLSSSCTQYPGSPANNSPEENDNIKSAIQATAQKSNLPAAYLLAVMMQESKGCVRAPTTNYGVNNPGLFQSFNGEASCNQGSVEFPCPAPKITQMVQEGAGINRPFGLQQAIEQSGATDDSKFYKAARIYNSGSLPQGGNLGQGIATHCYASDIANRLMGWTDQNSGCEEASIGSLTATVGKAQSQKTPAQPTTTPASQTETPQTETPQTETPQMEPTSANPPASPPAGHPIPSAHSIPSTTSSEPTAPKAQSAVANCKSWYTVKENDTCLSTGIPFETLRQLNTDLDENCSNLWLGSAYCVGV